MHFTVYGTPAEKAEEKARELREQIERNRRAAWTVKGGAKNE